LYTETFPVAGSMIVAWTKADWAVFASLQGPAAGLVAVIRYGVASPAALSGLAGTMSVQSAFGSAGAPPDGDGQDVGLSLGAALPEALVEALGMPADELALGIPADELALGIPAEELALGIPAEELALGMPAEELAVGAPDVAGGFRLW
jgi:hypothetical protein